MGRESPPCHAKADSVLSQAEELWNIDKDESTMGVIIYNSTYYTWLAFKQYSSLLRLLDLCKNEKQRRRLMVEWKAWVNLEKCFSGFWCNCIDLSFRDATSAGPVKTDGFCLIWKTHIIMNKKEASWISDTYESFVDNGVLLKPAKILFLDCCKLILNEECSIEGINKDDKRFSYYKKTYDEAVKQNKDLASLVDKWIIARNEWADEVSTVFLRSSYDSNTSEVLLGLASLISSIHEY